MICFNPDTENPVSQVSMRTLANKTQEMTTRLREKGYTVTEKWEHDFRKDLKDNQELQDFVKNHDSVDRLNPREAFFGGRTNAICLQYEGDAKYIDFTSLYPYCNKYKR